MIAVAVLRRRAAVDGHGFASGWSVPRAERMKRQIGALKGWQDIAGGSERIVVLQSASGTVKRYVAGPLKTPYPLTKLSGIQPCFRQSFGAIETPTCHLIAAGKSTPTDKLRHPLIGLKHGSEGAGLIRSIALSGQACSERVDISDVTRTL